MECWGAQGGNLHVTESGGQKDFADGGKGGYAKGSVALAANAKMYVCVGGQGGNINSLGVNGSVGGYNGGGAGGNAYDIENYSSGTGGGGATHIAKATGLLKNVTKANLYIVAGGGGGSSEFYSGGSGGGTTGGSGSYAGGSRSNGGSQTAGYAYGLGQRGGDAGGVGGTGCMEGRGGGGGGLYGGYAYQGVGQATSNSGGGGSGYIGGVSSGSMSNGVRTGNGYATITLTRW